MIHRSLLVLALLSPTSSHSTLHLTYTPNILVSVFLDKSSPFAELASIVTGSLLFLYLWCYLIKKISLTIPFKIALSAYLLTDRSINFSL